MKIAHLTTVDMSLRYLVLPQLEAARDFGESIGISSDGPFVAEVEARGIRHIRLPGSTRGMDLLGDARAVRNLWRILREERVDVLHTHNPKPGVYGRILGRLAGVPIVVNTVHGLYATPESAPLKRMVVYSLEWLASRFSDAELVQSPEDFEFLVRNRITPAARTSLLGNGVDLDRFDPKRAGAARRAVREELGVDDDAVVVGMVGRLVAEKGIPELIEAAGMLGAPYEFVVVGPDDPEKSDALPRELITEGERRGVRFLGMREDVEELYGGFDLFVLPSHREGFPRAAMEAAATGLPVVASDIRGCRQVVEDGVNGRLFAVGNVGQMVGAIEEIGSSPGLRDRMGRESRLRAEENFDERRVVEKVIAAYREVAALKGIDWAMLSAPGEITTRLANESDAIAVAELHRRMISSGFLSSLGSRFLELLYRALIESPTGVVHVAEANGTVAGFISGTADTGAFYREFLRKHAFRAVLRLIPSLLRPSNLRRILETLRHGSDEARADAELLSMAVAPALRRRGLGAGLVSLLLNWASDNGIDSMKVVVGVDNDAATGLYRSCGFSDERLIEVHRSEKSLELVWSR